MLFELENKTVNCTCNLPNGNYDYGEIRFTLTANENFDFIDTIPQIEFISNTGIHYRRDFEYVSDTEYTYFCEIKTNISYVTIIANALPVSSIKDKYGIITLYNPDINELKQLAKKKYFRFVNNSSENVDTTGFIISLFKIYCDVPTDYRANVYFGSHDMQIECNIISKDIITLDCGNVEILEKYNNSIDYNSTEIQIYLPFIGFINLPTNEFMDSTVNLKYKVNLINGESLAILTVNDNILLTENCNIGFKFPYSMENGNKITSDISNNNYFNLQPFIYIKRALISDSLSTVNPYNKTSIYDVLENYSGYSEISKLEFNIIHDFITFTEIEEIKAILASGVIL